jgi:hypothetical protein
LLAAYHAAAQVHAIEGRGWLKLPLKGFRIGTRRPWRTRGKRHRQRAKDVAIAFRDAGLGYRSLRRLLLFRTITRKQETD